MQEQQTGALNDASLVIAKGSKAVFYTITGISPSGDRVAIVGSGTSEQVYEIKNNFQRSKEKVSPDVSSKMTFNTFSSLETARAKLEDLDVVGMRMR